VDRHLTHDTARIVRFSVGIVNAANIGIFSAGQHGDDRGRIAWARLDW